MFALCVDELPLAVNLKCDSLYALELRSLYESVKGGYHMNKKHWNTVTLGGDVDDTLVKDLIDRSYALVYNKLTRKQKDLVVSMHIKLEDENSDISKNSILSFIPLQVCICYPLYF